MNRQPNRFEDFFTDAAYVQLKNLLYNYLLRKRAVNGALQGLEGGPLLEVGSGLSPMVTDDDRVTYSELSFAALRTLKKERGKGNFVVADALHLPFRRGAFAQVVCSEVLEHIPDDRAALAEISRVLKTGGSLILTVPHRQGYFAVDDRFVQHLRRYEIPDLEAMLPEAGLISQKISKVLGPMEKLLMMAVTMVLHRLHPESQSGRRANSRSSGAVRELFLFRWFNRLLAGLVWVDARLFPRFLASVLLLRCVKK